MRKRMKKTICILLAAIMMFTMTACSKKTEPAEGQQPESQTEDQTQEAAEEFDIAANLQIADGVDGEGGSTHVVDTDHFTLTLSHSGTWDYEIDSKTSVTFYNIAGREAGCGGRLFSLIAYEPDDKSYETLPSYSVVGEKDGKVYVAEYPSDVQADVENEQNMNDYMEVFEEVDRIRTGGADSPLILK